MTGGNRTAGNPTAGSALILVVVLTSILAIVGALFVISSRVDHMSTTSIRQERDLDAAIETLVTKFANELVLDINGITAAEYYDYPGDKDTWLASLEPYEYGTNDYRWGQISDLTGYILDRGWDTRDITLDKSSSDLLQPVVPENKVIQLDEDGQIYEGRLNKQGQFADADGDGVADAKWFELEDISSSTGGTLYAAVRIIDNGGMLNLNTAYLFDPNKNDPNYIDGSRLAQVNLMSVVKGPTDNPIDIHTTRCDDDNPDLLDFNKDCAIRLENPDRRNINYLPYDISDELELRNRFLLDAKDNICRIERAAPESLKYGGAHTRCVPIDTPKEFHSTTDSNNWTSLLDRDTLETGENYDFRHILTAFNTDRIISPALPNDVNVTNGIDGAILATMLNINLDPNNLNDANDNYDDIYSWKKAREFYHTFISSLDPNLSQMTRKRMKREYAQLAVNMVDLRDEDTLVTTLSLPDIDIGRYDNDFIGREFVYGMEPYPVITQVAIRIDPNDPCMNTNYYAVELFNPFDHDIDFDEIDSQFDLLVTDVNANYDPCDPNTFGAIVIAEIPLTGILLKRSNGGDFHVVYNRWWPAFNITGSSQQDNRLILSSGYHAERDPMGGDPIIDANIVNSHNVVVRRRVTARHTGAVTDTTTRYIYPERQLIYQSWVRWKPINETRFYGRKFRLDGPPAPKWWDVVYTQTDEQRIADANFSDPCGIGSFRLGANDYNRYPPFDTNDRPAIDIALPYGNWEDEDYNRDLITVGDIARIWSIGPGDVLYDPNDANSFAESAIFDVNAIDVTDPCDPNDANDTRIAKFQTYKRTVGETLRFVSLSIELAQHYEDEDFIRLNLGDPHNANLFNYITVFDPRVDGINNDGDGWTDEEEPSQTPELKIKGRININTAPRFVLEQLPWMTAEIAEAIVAYRDMRDITGGPDYSKRYSTISGELDKNGNFSKDDLEYILDKPGFGSIGELNLVISKTGSNDYSIRHYALPGNSLESHSFPDLTDAYGLDDEADDDFEERDLIFARISNLVTVRSDVFTAYILVRLGTDGPQKRVIAILDRSDVYDGAGKVKLIALHPVPDAR